MKHPPASRESTGTGYYGGYYYGEGYTSHAESAFSATRSVKDYLIILRERIWWLIITAFVVFIGSLIYTFNATPFYASVASVQVLRQGDVRAGFMEVVDMTVRNVEDFNTQTKILESSQVILRVADRLKDDVLRRFTAPFEEEGFAWRPARTVPELLFSYRAVVPERLSLMIRIQYRHPDPEIAAIVANLFAEEFINYNLKLRIDGSLKAVDDLRERAEQQRIKMEEIEMQLNAFKERHKSVSFDASTDIDQQQLLQLNEMRTISKQILDDAEARWQQVLTARAEGRPLWELSFIAMAPQVPDLQARRSLFMIELSALQQKYRHRHPRLIETRTALEQTEQELRNAVDSAAEVVLNNLRKARTDFQNAEQRITEKRSEVIDLQRLRVEYNSMERNLEVNRQLYQYLYSRMQQALTQATDDVQTARVVDVARPAIKPSSPNPRVNLTAGLFGGILLGFGMVFLLALLDDKVKTAFDIESNIGLPLIGIVPRISKGESKTNARAAEEGDDRHTVEAFRGIHSTLKLNEESKQAKVVLTTSTIPSEGKSFVTTNLAFTFASHGEKTIVVDGDLRMPNIATSLGLESKVGLLQVLNGEAELDGAIIRGVAPNVDVLVTGGRTKNPTQMLGSDRFASVLQELRARYDKVLIDSPPLAPVSDALNVLPFVDGVLYVIRFNTVKQKTAAVNVRRLRDSNVPVFGAILNNINTAVAGYYYSHYYDKSYSHYFIESAVDAPLAPASSVPKEREKPRADARV